LESYISQVSAPTRFGCGEIFNDSFSANCPDSAPVKKF